MTYEERIRALDWTGASVHSLRIDSASIAAEADKKLTLAEESLKFYGQEKRYGQPELGGPITILADGGKRARAALAALKEESNG